MRAIVFRAMDEEGKELLYLDGFENDNDNDCTEVYTEAKKNYEDKNYQIGLGMWSVELYDSNDDVLDCFPLPSHEGYLLLNSLRIKLHLI